MAQHDMNIANQGFPATRADLNNALQALVSNSSGATAPSTTFANQWWYDTTNNKLYIRNEANNAWIQVAVLDQTNNEWQITTGQISAGDSDGILFKTDDGTTRATLDDSGNFLVGAAAPTPGNGNTDTGHLLKSDGRLFSSSASNSQFNRNSNGDILTFRRSGNLVGQIGVEATDNFYISDVTGNSGLNIKGYINPCGTNGETRDAAIDLGGSSGRFKDLYLSGGIRLGGTTSANLMSDYEEGNWVPTAFGSTTGSGTQITLLDTSTAGYYTKIGRQVTVVAEIDVSATNSASGTFTVGNLPFNVANLVQPTSIESNGSVAFWSQFTTSVNSVNITAQGGTSTAMLRGLDADRATAGGSLTVSAVGTGEFRFTLTYFT